MSANPQTFRTIYSRIGPCIDTNQRSNTKTIIQKLCGHLITIAPLNADCVDKVFKLNDANTMRTFDICQDKHFELKYGTKKMDCYVSSLDNTTNEYILDFSSSSSFEHLTEQTDIRKFVSDKWYDIDRDAISGIQNRSPFDLLISTKNILSCPYVQARANRDHTKPGKLLF